MLVTLFLSFMTLTGLQQTDSVSNEWLVNEWNKSYETEIVDFTLKGQIIIVSQEGELLHKFDKESLNERCTNCISAYQKSDFLFTLNNDDYYLLPGISPVIQPSETVQYSSAE